jgi:hypothetical protein
VQCQWVIIVAKTSKKFTDIKMGTENFVLLQQMGDIRDSVKGLHSMQWFHSEKDQPHKFF